MNKEPINFLVTAINIDDKAQKKQNIIYSTSNDVLINQAAEDIATKLSIVI